MDRSSRIMDNDLDLSALRAFRAVVRLGSFSGAAASLRTPKSTLSKRVADLEADLGVRLIERTTRALRVTAEGEALAARADRLLSEADDIRRALGESGAAPRGHLRIAVPTLMGHLFLGRLAAGFRAAYPDITLECHVLDRPPDLLEEGFDGAIRVGPLEDSSLVARVLRHSEAAMVAAPSLPGIGSVLHPRDLAALPLLGSTPWSGPLTLLHHPSGESVDMPTDGIGLRLGSPLALRDAAVEGAGIALLPRLLADGEIAAGRLVRLLPDWATPRKPIAFVYPSAQSMTARLRAFIDWTAARLGEAENPRAEKAGSRPSDPA